MQSNGSILAQQPIHMTIQADQGTEASENVERVTGIILA